MSLEEEIQKYNKLAKHHELANQSITRLQEEVKRKDEAIRLLLLEKKQWLEAKENQTNIFQKMLDQQNALVQQIQSEIDHLRKENIEYKKEIDHLKDEV